MWFLFLVRSLGSIALRKAEDVDFKYHFNFFSVNFNEELVALYGGSLQQQTKFVHECIKVILKLYRVSSNICWIMYLHLGMEFWAVFSAGNLKNDE